MRTRTRGGHSEPQNIATALKQMILDPSRHALQFGIVERVDKATGTVVVQLEPSDPPRMTDYIRYIGLGMAFGKWRGVHLPDPGTEVALLSLDPDGRGYVALGGLYNDEDTPPGYTEGSVLWQHEGGNKVLLDADGTVYVGDKSGAEGLLQASWATSNHDPHTHPHPLGPTGPVTTPASGHITTKVKGA